jgi:hypothetical protein
MIISIYLSVAKRNMENSAVNRMVLNKYIAFVSMKVTLRGRLCWLSLLSVVHPPLQALRIRTTRCRWWTAKRLVEVNVVCNLLVLLIMYLLCNLIIGLNKNMWRQCCFIYCLINRKLANILVCWTIKTRAGISIKPPKSQKVAGSSEEHPMGPDVK